MGRTRKPARPAPAPLTAKAKRLERVRTQSGFPSLRSFWQKLIDGWDEGAAVSYEAVRGYHFNREPPADYLARVADVFGYRLEWLVTGKGAARSTHEREAETTHAVLSALFGAANGLRPLGVWGVDQLALAAVPNVAMWIGPVGAGMTPEGMSEEDRYVRAAQMLGEAIAAPLRVLGLDPSEWPEPVKAQYVMPMLATLQPLLDISFSKAAQRRLLENDERPSNP